MTTGDALMAAIIANPKDDTPRLVYADWLEENGGPDRAEFIRVQIEIAAGATTLCESKKVTPCYAMSARTLCPGCERARELRARELELWRKWAEDQAALKPTATLTDVEDDCGVADGMSTRGFISRLRCSWKFWHKKADEICKMCPIEDVDLTTIPPWEYFDSDQTMVYGPGWTDRTYVLSEMEQGRCIHELLCEARWPGIKFQIPGYVNAPVISFVRDPARHPVNRYARMEVSPESETAGGPHPMVPFTHPYRR